MPGQADREYGEVRTSGECSDCTRSRQAAPAAACLSQEQRHLLGAHPDQEAFWLMIIHQSAKAEHDKVLAEVDCIVAAVVAVAAFRHCC